MTVHSIPEPKFKFNQTVYAINWDRVKTYVKWATPKLNEQDVLLTCRITGIRLDCDRHTDELSIQYTAHKFFDSNRWVSEHGFYATKQEALQVIKQWCLDKLKFRIDKFETLESVLTAQITALEGETK